MKYTGYLVTQYIDENPNSSGYGETWTERVLNLGTCPNGSGGEWTLISSECEMDTSGHTGLRINTYYNDVTGEYSSTTVADADCASSAQTYDDEEHWINSGDPYCEIDDNGLYTGMGIQLQVQTNFNFLSYGSTREVRIEMSECSGYTQPQWEEISHQCHVVTDELTCYLTFDGTADILQIDTNPSSPTFNHTRTISGESEECYCEACDRIDYSWRLIDDVCGIQMPSNYGLTGLTDDTVYHVYRKYGTCIIDGQSGATKPMNEYSAVTYQTGVTDCIYRWVDTEETVCVEEFNGKFQAIYNDSTTYSAACDSSTTLTSSETKPSGYEASAMTSAVIGDDCVTSIGNYAFHNCYGLTSCTIPNSVISIGEAAFYQCYNLTNIVIPNGVTSISDTAFYSCRSLTSVVIPSGITTINNHTFAQCEGLTSITIPNSVISIGNAAFRSCVSLTRIEIPSGVTSIGNSAFQTCFGLTSVGLVGSDASIEIPNGVTSISNYIFYWCTGLTSVVIPSGITTIGESAFEHCQSLTSITVNRVTPPTLGINAFNDTNDAPIYVPAQSVEAYKTASGWSTYASRITSIPNS